MANPDPRTLGKALAAAGLLTIILLGLPQSRGWAMARRPPSENEKPLRRVTLEALYELALERSEDVAIRKEEVKKTGALFMKSTGEAVGDGNLILTDSLQDRASGGGGEGGVGGTLTREERRERKVVITQPLFQGFRSLGALTGAGSLRRQRVGETQRAEELLFLQTMQAFYNLLEKSRDREIIQEIVVLFKDRIGELGEREKIGRSRTSEAATARARMKTLEAELAEAQGAVELARHMLYFLTGLELLPEELAAPDVPSHTDLPLESYLTRVEVRSDVDAAREAAKTAKRAIIVAQSELWPEISLENNNYLMREGFQSNIDWDVLFKIDIPLYKGGTVMGDVKEKWGSWKQAKLTESLTRRRADLEIRQAYQNWQTSREQFSALEEAIESSDQNLHFQKEEYERSLVSNLDVLAALQSLLESRREGNASYYKLKRNYWELQLAVGKIPVILAGTDAMEGEVT